MSGTSGNGNGGGIGFVGLLQIVFIVLKLIGVINWGWVYVLMPTILSFSLGLLMLILAIALGVFNK